MFAYDMSNLDLTVQLLCKATGVQAHPAQFQCISMIVCSVIESMFGILWAAVTGGSSYEC